MNKRIFTFILALLPLLSGCGDRLFIPQLPQQKGSEGFTFSVNLPRAMDSGMGTKAMDAEAITSLWVLVFDDQGFFVESSECEPVAPASFGVDMNVEYKFKATLQASISKRVLHFVANYDFVANPVKFGTEYYVIHLLSVSGNQDAYWQRIELDGGIPENGDISLMSANDRAKIEKIPLVRNFAKVKVVSELSNFELTGFALWNVPDRGCVAPCMMELNSFAVYAKHDDKGDAFRDNPWVSRSYDELHSSYDAQAGSPGYTGFLTDATRIVATDPSTLDFTLEDKYIYERPFSGDVTNTALIIKGKYDGHAESYYKIDFVRAINAGIVEYYNILRSFVYTANIVACTSDGYSTAAEAAAAPAANNFVASVMAQDIINISDGTGRLHVGYTDTTVVSSEPFYSRFIYYPDFKNRPGYVDNNLIKTYDRVTVQPVAPGGAVIKDYTRRDIDGTEASGSEWGDWREWKGWRVVKITPQEPSDEEKVQTVVYFEPSPTGQNVKIARTVTYHLRKPYSMQLECSPSTIAVGLNREVLLNIKIPTGLAYYLFPLEFKIEVAANSLTPDNRKSEDLYRSGYMSTWYGQSMIPGNGGKQSYGFTKTVSYADYLSMQSTPDNSRKIIPCSFKTTKSNSGSVIWVKNKYFGFGQDISTVRFNN